MKIRVKKELFLKSLNIVTKAIIKRGDMLPILSCVLVDASKNKIILTCTDLNITIKKEAEGEIIENGISAIDGNLLLSSIKNMPEDQEILITVNKNRECNITCNEIKQSFLTKDETTYPNIMVVNKDNKVIINEYKFKTLIDKTSFSYEKNNQADNIILKGIYLKTEKERIIAKSMDGYILSIVNDYLMKDFGKYEVIVPGNALEEVIKLINGDTNKEVFRYFNDKNIAFEFNNTLFSSTIIPNKYIDTDKIISAEYFTKITVNRSEIIESLYRANLFTNEQEKKPVVFDIKEEKMNISLQSLIGENNENINIKKTGKDLRIAFNPHSLINILNVIPDENVTLYFSGSKQPVIIKDKQENYIYLLTAVNI